MKEFDPSGSAALPRSLVEGLHTVRSVGVVTGAGISKESGIQTYRGEGGLYDDPDEGDRTVEALPGPTLAVDPDRTWRAVAGLARQALDAAPNAAHQALFAIERKVERFVLLTQNVDGLHRLAGSRNIIDIHGDVFATLCTSCGVSGRLDRAALAALAALERSPRCDSCGGLLRPDAVLFGEMIPPEKYLRVREEFHRDTPDLVMVVGTSALFPYITDPVLVARRSGKLTVEINPEPTLLSDVVQHSLRGTAGIYLPRIERAIHAGTEPA